MVEQTAARNHGCPGVGWSASSPHCIHLFLLPMLALSSNPLLQLFLLRFYSFTLEQEKNSNSVLKFLKWHIFKTSIVSLLRTMLIHIYLLFLRARYIVK